MSIGLDIGTRTIKVVQIDTENGNRLQASGVVGYRGESIEKLIEEKDIAIFADILIKLFKSAGIQGNDVSVSLPETFVYTRSIRLPLLTDQEVAAAIKWEAEQYIPIPIKEAIVQHQVLERKDKGSDQGVLVLLVAAPRTLVDKFIKVLSAARLNIVAAETELMSIVRSLAPQNQTSMIIDFGARSVDIAIASNGLLAFSRTIPTGGDALTRALTQNLRISMQEAEQYKRTYGLSSTQLEGKIKQSISPIISAMVDEFKKAIHFYQTEEKGQVPTSTIVSGGMAGMPELISFLTDQLGTEVLVANPFTKVKVDENAWTNLAPYAPLYSVAVGLALR